MLACLLCGVLCATAVLLCVFVIVFLVLLGLGDCICQHVTQKPLPYNYVRTAQFAFVGTVLVGPAVHTYVQPYSAKYSTRTTHNTSTLQHCSIFHHKVA